MGILEQFLEGYSAPEKQFLIGGFTNGFHVPFDGNLKFRDCKNLLSARRLPHILKNKIIAEIEAKRVVGPFDKPPFEHFQVSPLGLVPKHEAGEFRVIHHLSFPEGASVNDGIDQEHKTVHYQNIDDAITLIKKFGQGSLMAKADIAHAYKLVPVSQESFKLMGFKVGEKYFYDKTLPMGLSVSCQWFELFSSALHWILEHKFGVTGTVHILDDFIFVTPPNFQQCNQALESFLRMCNETGIPVKHSKTVRPCHCLTFLGIELDTWLMEARLPVDKIQKIRSLLRDYSSRTKLKLVEIQSLVGLLNFACSVVVPGRCFLRRLIQLTKGVRKAHYRIRITSSAKSDMRIWLLFIEQYNCKSFFLADKWESSEVLKLFTDASNVGYGGVFQKSWFYGRWPRSFEKYHITVKELFPIVIALESWGHLIANKCIEFYTDNEAVSVIINSQTSRDETLMNLLRRLVLCTLKHNIMFRSKCLLGRLNVLPDMLSRLQIDEFRKIAVGMNSQPETLNRVDWEI